jgi:ATP-dependent exoDNAse (exonuclease V) alpha subunit
MRTLAVALAHVALSRGRDDAQIYTNDKSRLAEALNRDVSHRAAIEQTHPLRVHRKPSNARSVGQIGIGLGL